MESDTQSHPKKFKTIMRPSNPFNDPFNIGLFGGAVLGLIGGYCVGGVILPTLRKILHTVYNGKSKLVLVVRDDLGMSKGKIASQCSHATMVMHKKLLSPLTRYKDGRGLLAAWAMGGEPTIVLRVANMKGLQDILNKAKENKVTTSVVYDAGRTEVVPGSLTVIAVGPGNEDGIDEVTGHLRTL